MKNKLYRFILLFITSLVFSQSPKNISGKIFLDSSGNETSEGNHTSYRIIRNYSSDSDHYEINDYYKSGSIQMKGLSSSKYKLQKNGTFIFYHENGLRKSISNYKSNRQIGKEFRFFEDGTIESEIEFIENVIGFEEGYKIVQFWNKERQHKVIDGNGEYETYDITGIPVIGEVKNGLKDGQWTGSPEYTGLKFTDLYKNGKFISGKIIDSTGRKLSYKRLIEEGKPKKGFQDFQIHISKALMKSQVVKKTKLSGKIYFLFTVEKDGNLTNLKVFKGLDETLDKEVLNTLKNCGIWIPAKIRGIETAKEHSLPIIITAINRTF